jgi:hypothetical protein
MSPLFYELLNKERMEAFEKLKSFKKEGVLAGGTALLLQMGHRLSFDFDIFLGREIKRSDLLKLKKLFLIREVGLQTSDQLNIITSDNVRITLFHYLYKPLFPLISTISLPIYSVKDVALDKAFTLGQRPIWRDYVDLFFILKKDVMNLSEILKLGEKKFDFEFNPRLFLEQLVYFKDLQMTKVSFVREKYSPKEIKDFLKKQAGEFKKLKI